MPMEPIKVLNHILRVYYNLDLPNTLREKANNGRDHRYWENIYAVYNCIYLDEFVFTDHDLRVVLYVRYKIFFVAG
jgi:hypothetical protein